MTMRLSILAAATGGMLAIGAGMHAQAQTATPAPTPSKAGINAGSLSCNVAGGVGFIFGSSKELSCIFAGNDGPAQRYKGTIKRFGIDIGFTKEAHVIWLVFAPGKVESGALAGDYAGATAAVAAGVGVGVNVLIGGGNKQITLQPVSVEGSVGLNVAAGVAQIALEQVK